MAKLYQRQNPLLQRGQIIQPEKQPSIGAAVAKFGANALDKIAKDNFVLGHANLTNDIVNTAYTANPMNLKRFNEMVQSGIEKSTKNLPGDMARQIRLSAEKKANAFTAKIESNIRKAATAEMEQNATLLQDDIINGPSGLKDSNIGMMDCLINRDAEGLKKFRENWDYQHKQLSALAELKNPFTGSYVIGKESTRNTYKQGLIGKMDAFRGGIEKLSKDGLKKFDEEVFQDKELFMKQYGVDYDTYDDMEKLIKSRRKAFDEQDKRQIKDQAYFRASQYSQLTPEIMQEIKDSNAFPDDTIKKLEKVSKQLGKDGNPDAAFLRNLDKNESFLAGIMELQDAISTDDGSEDYNNKLIDKGADISLKIDKMRVQGAIDDEQAEILQSAISGIVSNQDFANALDTHDSSLLSEIVRGSYNDFNVNVQNRLQKLKEKYPELADDENALMRAERYSKFASGMAMGSIRSKPNKIEFTDLTSKALKARAAQYEAQIIALERAGAHEQAIQLKQNANKELIYLKYADWIPRQEFDRLEKELKNSGKAYTTIGNSIFQFKGLSQNGIILEGEF